MLATFSVEANIN